MNSKQAGFEQVLLSQIRNSIHYTRWGCRPVGDMWLDICIEMDNPDTWKRPPIRILGVAEDNLKFRRIVAQNNAVWRECPDNDVHVSQFDAVVVMYAPAWEPGATWKDSSGNPFKDDFRRLSLIGDISKSNVPMCYNEIHTHLTEANILRLVMGMPLRLESR